MEKPTHTIVVSKNGTMSNMIKFRNFIYLFQFFVFLFDVGYAEIADDRLVLLERYEKRQSRPSYGGQNIYLTGEINRPLNISLEKLNKESASNLKNLILLGGGVTDFADKKIVIIYRDFIAYKISCELGEFDKIKLDQGDVVFIPPKVFMGR